MADSRLSTTYTLDLDEIDRDSIAVAGGKGANLGELVRAGFPVPQGFVITTDGYRAFVEHNGLRDRIVAAARAAGTDGPQGTEEIARTIAGLFEDGEIPPTVADDVARRHSELSEGGATAVAVRSSATAEDLPEASFAGQQATILNVKGHEQLLAAVKSCWASLWTARAIAYRARQGIDPATVNLAVVVQRMVEVDAAGILFTANPVSGARDEAVIDAAWGLGDAIVGGDVTPDHIVIGTATMAAREMRIAEKRVKSVPRDGTIVLEDVPAGRERRPVLDEPTAVELTRLGLQIEDHFGAPQDIEWCRSNGQLMILQSRPITSLPPAPLEWDAPEGSQWLRGGGVMELVTEPISPLMATLVLPTLEETTYELTREFGLEGLFSWPMGAVVNGHLYGRVELHPRPWHILGLIRNLRAHRKSIDRWPDTLESYRSRVAELSDPPAEDLPSQQLIRRAEQLVRAAGEFWNELGMVVRLVIGRSNRFTKQYTAIRRETDPEPEELLRGQLVKPVEAERSAYALSEAASELPGVAEVILAGDEDVVSRLEETAPGREFLSLLREHLSQYGYQIFSLDPAVPPLDDDWHPVLMGVRSYLSGREPPDAWRVRVAREQQAALAMISSRLSKAQQRKLEEALDEAREGEAMREEGMFELGLAWRPMRRALLELGSRLQQAHVIGDASDVFFLQREELRSAAAQLDSGASPAPLHDTVDVRKQEQETQRGRVPPPLLPVGSTPKFWWKHVFPAPELDVEEASETVEGFGVSPGRVTAVARVVLDPRQVSRLGAGEVLVTRTTTPAWTPLFSLASALVTDLGGPLAHGSIVAREYGIPAVMGTGNATRRIQDGQEITVDGSAGRVLLK